MAELAERVSDLVRRARIVHLPIAHLHQGEHGAATALQIPIGRYDPVFKAVDLWDEFPNGLIEFIASSPSKTINLAGAIRQAQFDRLVELLADAGFVARIQSAALISLEDEAA